MAICIWLDAMSRDKLADRLNAAIQIRRKYAAFFDCPDKKLKEWDVVCELLRSMHASGDCRYLQKVESVHDVWPDCVIRDSAGVQVGVEITEFVDQNSVEMSERGMNVYREWSDQAVREKISQILRDKDRKAYHGGLYGKAILVIHTDEVELRSFRLFPILNASVFPRPENIDEAYLLCSYEPTLVAGVPDDLPDDAPLDDDPNPYPYARLNFEK